MIEKIIENIKKDQFTFGFIIFLALIGIYLIIADIIKHTNLGIIGFMILVLSTLAFIIGNIDTNKIRKEEKTMGGKGSGRKAKNSKKKKEVQEQTKEDNKEELQEVEKTQESGMIEPINIEEKPTQESTNIGSVEGKEIMDEVDNSNLETVEEENEEN